MTLETLNLERKEKITNDRAILTISTICMCEELRILHKLKYINILHKGFMKTLRNRMFTSLHVVMNMRESKVFNYYFYFKLNCFIH